VTPNDCPGARAALLFDDEIPGPHGIAVIGPAEACGVFERALTPGAYGELRGRIEQITSPRAQHSGVPMRPSTLLLLLLASATAAGAFATTPPSVPAVDAPELARLGPYAVGVRTVTLIERDQPDLLALDVQQGMAARRDRSLTVDIWYPARARPRAVAESYRASLESEQPGTYTSFSIPALARRGARAAGGHYPLVIVSHGLRNATVTLSWLTENLASKGYVVAAIRHEDPSAASPFRIVQPLLRRPLDIGFVAASLQGSLAAEGLVDPARTALIGYSMGGFGVLAAAGATIDPDAAKLVPGGLLLPYARGGVAREAMLVRNLKAVVAIVPVGGGPPYAWGPDGMAALTAPLLLIAGDRDHVLDYARGARAFFEDARGTHRYLLTLRGAGHNIGLDNAPDAMRQRLWDLAWFEDPVWRKERTIGINLHMITAFLDRYVKGDESRAAYLDGLVPDAASGQWPATETGGFGAYSTGTNGVTVWKGFQRNYAEGLELLQRDAEPPGN
jgi:predicted dienelactone hydrolase